MFYGICYNHMTSGPIIISFQFHEVGELMILHKKTQPKMLQVREKSRLFFRSYYVLETCKDMQFKYGELHISFLEVWEISWKIFLQSLPMQLSTPFFSPSDKKIPEKKLLMTIIYGSIKIFSNNNDCSFGEKKMQILHDPFLNYN